MNEALQSAKLTPLTVQQYAEISDDIYDEIERVEHGGIIAAKCVKHPEYGDIILISSPQGGCLMIHFEPTLASYNPCHAPESLALSSSVAVQGGEKRL